MFPNIFNKKLNVPYVQQVNPNACGAAVLEMVYKYYGLKNISQNEIFEQYKELEPHGSGNLRMTTDSLVSDARKRNFEAGWARVNYNKEDTICLIKILVKKTKMPIIVCQKYTDQQSRIGHFRVVIDINDEFIYFHDPSEEIGGSSIKWSIDKFMNFWQPTGENVTGGVFVVIKNK